MIRFPLPTLAGLAAAALLRAAHLPAAAVILGVFAAAFLAGYLTADR